MAELKSKSQQNEGGNKKLTGERDVFVGCFRINLSDLYIYNIVIFDFYITKLILQTAVKPCTKH